MHARDGILFCAVRGTLSLVHFLFTDIKLSVGTTSYVLPMHLCTADKFPTDVDASLDIEIAKSWRA
jgi:hypothetical protein